MLKKKEEQTTGKNIGKNMCKIEQKLQRKHLIALSFFLPLLVIGRLLYCIWCTSHFGDNFRCLIIDGLHQYMPFYSVLYDKLKGGKPFFTVSVPDWELIFYRYFPTICPVHLIY